MQHIDARSQVALKQRVLEDALWHIGRVRPQIVLRPSNGPALAVSASRANDVRYVAKKGGVLVGFTNARAAMWPIFGNARSCRRRSAIFYCRCADLVGALTIRERMPQIELAVGTLADRECGDAWCFACCSRRPQKIESAARVRPHAHAVGIWLQPAGPDSAAPLDRDQPHRLELSAAGVRCHTAIFANRFHAGQPSVNQVLVSRAVGCLAPSQVTLSPISSAGLGISPCRWRRVPQRSLGLKAVLRCLSGRASRRQTTGWPIERRSRCAICSNSLRRLVRTARATSCNRQSLIDPPRDGALAVVQALTAPLPARFKAPSKVVYVSCNPATLARDCGFMVNQGWALRAAGVINMFPHTSHVESIALLEPPAWRA